MEQEMDSMTPFDPSALACDETAAAFFYLKRLDAAAQTPAASKESLLDMLTRIAALATKVKTEINAYLSRTQGKELVDFDGGYPVQIDEKLDVVFDSAFFFGKADDVSEDALREKIRTAQIAASALPMLIAQMESEASMEAAAKQK